MEAAIGKPAFLEPAMYWNRSELSRRTGQSLLCCRFALWAWKKKKKDSQLMFVCGKCFSVLGPYIVCSKRNPYLPANQQQAFPFVTFWRFCYSLSWLLQNGYCHSSTLGHLRNNKRFLCNTVHFSLIFHLEINLKKIWKYIYAVSLWVPSVG